MSPVDGLADDAVNGTKDATGGEVDTEHDATRDDPAPVHITVDLLALLCERAADADPEAENVVLDATPAGELIDAPTDIDPATPVLTHFYFPSAGGSVSAVFGMDLGRPAGSARFLSHPRGDRHLTEEDDLAAAVLVAVPPYERENVIAYDRRGRRRELVVVDAEPPEERVEE
ncbi:hypothetical protein [Halobaculum magnesiiphilum]|uniref:Proteasome lid subunit RPN8/RPN11, contains Jab1/MPN metalloenzyme (JAMM) motif n=1 Tax=Halobaculum magnesiiphilum TaxID=1017351 RepID=A0A8T8WCI6_9EURY|nr:hypothetical protein [Halobaculum magnesiiphilum]QZP37531.1 hypothetical protein K6T50_14835 [Halobaculum magnesiiphilum]